MSPRFVSPEEKIKKVLQDQFALLKQLIGQIPQEVLVRDFQEHLEAIWSEITRLQSDLVRFSTKKRGGHMNLKFALADLERRLQEAVEDKDLVRDEFRAYEERVKAAVAQIREVQDGLLAKIAELEAMLEAPRPYAVVVRVFPEERKADVMLRGERMQVNAAKDVNLQALRRGQRVLCAPDGNILRALDDEFEERGFQAIVSDVLEDGRVRLESGLDEKTLAFQADALKDTKLQVGDIVLWDRRSNFIMEVLPKSEASALLFEDIPDITFADIGGQDKAIEKLRQFTEWPLLYPEKFARFKARVPAGVLLWGPPGNGKTMALKALANELRKREGKKVYFLLVRGPELLNMFVGNTEAAIRAPFILAESKLREEPDALMILFFDEADALFPTRGTRTGDAGVSQTSVTQIATMLDGVRDRGNITIAATTNRPDILDPSLTRPGRIYPPIEFVRPDQDGVRQILTVNLQDPDVPLDEKYVDPQRRDYEKKYEDFEGDREKVFAYFVDKIIIRIFGDPEASSKEREEQLDRQRVVSIEYTDTGETESFFMKDLISGAYCAEIVDRAKLYAIGEEIASGDTLGLILKHFYEALEEIFLEGESLPNRSQPQEWARLLGLPEQRPFTVLPKAESKDEKSERSQQGVSGT